MAKVKLSNLHLITSSKDIEFPIWKIDVSAFCIPTASEYETIGVSQWNKSTLVLVQIHAGNETGLGYTYMDKSAAHFIKDTLSEEILGKDALNISQIWRNMFLKARNTGRLGLASMAISAIDHALWDLKAKLFNLSLVKLLGQEREAVPIYGSGGFTSYTIPQLQEQLACWVAQDICRVKMKVGRNPEDDVRRVKAAREAIGTEAELYVDADETYSRKQALQMAKKFLESNVSIFEEPSVADDLASLRLIRNHSPAEIEIAAGEHGDSLNYFQRMINAKAVDIVQLNAARCMGITGFIKISTLCESSFIDISAQSALSIHVHLSCALSNVRHMEYFFDHVRIENLFFDGVLQPKNGMIRPDLNRKGLGLEFKKADAAPYTA